MKGLSYTLLGDGRSDRVLDFPIRWALRSIGVPVERGEWADLSGASPKPSTLTDRARIAIELYPADLLFVHRDAENGDFEDRIAEIRDAVATVTSRYVAIVPVRMTEAWLLHDVDAIRRASGNPNGKVDLSLPPISKLQKIPNPKLVLEEALLKASELGASRLKKKKKDFPQMRHRVAELIRDFGPLRELPAFMSFVDDLRTAVKALGYHISNS